ncbi:MAG: hypothetical protein IKM19_10150 [Firmicutes bacterium]|nr:hypothetical protein [Bacillota bacterium]
MKKKISVLLMVLVMVLSATVTSYAAVGDGGVVSPQSTSSVDFNISRSSGTTADAEVLVTFTSEADEYSVVVYLQKKVNGVWTNDNTNDEYVFYNNGINSRTVAFANTYDSLVYGTTYRLMVVSRDIHGTSEYRATTYSNSF